jgi:hypothetical protein
LTGFPLAIKMIRDNNYHGGVVMKRVGIYSAIYIALQFSAAASMFGQSSGRIASRFGETTVAGERVIVHVVVAVPPGLDENVVAENALRGQGARPLQSADFATTGLKWDQFFNSSSTDDKVTQYYNPAAESMLGAYSSLQAAQATWNAVSTSQFWFQDGGNSSRCPSLVKECPGPQTYDTYNDIGWAAISGCCTLGVTWYSTTTDEADMALNTRIQWTTGGGSGYDVQTVLLHEEGHALGLDHSTVTGAVMEAYYGGVRQALSEDEVRGATYLYPEPGSVSTVSGNVSALAGGGIGGAKISVANIPSSTSSDANGNYSFAGVPDIGVYEVTASASGYKSLTKSLDPKVPSSLLDFVLEPGSIGGGRCNPRKPGCSN